MCEEGCLTHPTIVKQLGGRKEAVAATKEIMKTLTDKGITFTSLKSGVPSDPVRSGKATYILVPTTLEMKAPQGRIVGTSFVLGVSADAGKTWGFIEGAAGEADIRESFPDIPKALVFPKVEYKIVKD